MFGKKKGASRARDLKVRRIDEFEKDGVVRELFRYGLIKPGTRILGHFIGYPGTITESSWLRRQIQSWLVQYRVVVLEDRIVFAKTSGLNRLEQIEVFGLNVISALSAGKRGSHLRLAFEMENGRTVDIKTAAKHIIRARGREIAFSDSVIQCLALAARTAAA